MGLTLARHRDAERHRRRYRRWGARAQRSDGNNSSLLGVMAQISRSGSVSSPIIPGMGSVGLYTDFRKGTLVSDRGPNWTYTRGGNLSTGVDFEGLVRVLQLNEARFENLRRVENLVLGHSNDFTNAAWTKAGLGTGIAPVVTANFAQAPDGSMTASRAQFNSGAGVSGGDLSQIYQAVASVLPANHRVSWWAKSNNGASQKLSITADDTTTANVTVTTAWTRISAIGVSANSYIQVVLSGTWKSADTADILLWGAQSENVIGQANQNPGEYVSRGVKASPWFGAGVDAVRYFTYANGNTVAGNIVTEAQGASLDLTKAKISPFDAATHISLRNRDLTNATWVKGATATVARDQVGADGTINGASRITAGAVQATNTVLQTVVLASSVRAQEALVKLISGAGVWEMTTDNGITWTAIQTFINSGAYTRVRCPLQTVTNPVFGFRGGANAGAIAVDFITNTSIVNAPVVEVAAASVAITADAGTAVGGAGFINQIEGTLFVQALGPLGITTYPVMVSIDDNGTPNAEAVGIYVDAVDSISRGFIYDNSVAVAGVQAGTVAAADVMFKGAMRYRLNDTNYAKGGAVGTADTACTMPTTTTFRLGLNGGVQGPNTGLQVVAYSPTGATDANLALATT